MTSRKRICFVCSAPVTFEAFLAPMVRGLAANVDVTVVMNGRPALPEVHAAVFLQVGVERSVMPVRDCWALLQLIRLFYTQRFDAVHSVTPKAGLLAMLAARITGIRCRHHTFTGQIWATRTGAARWILKAMDRILAACASEVLADSPSQLRFLMEQGIVLPGRGLILGTGSICGVNLERFRPDVARRLAMREELALETAATVFLYLGRMKREKGLLDLADAFRSLAKEQAGVQLLLVGPDEEGLIPLIRDRLAQSGHRLIVAGSTARPEDYMQAADVFCLPSYREGFGTVIIEAAACGLPCVASRIYGITDAVEDRVSGLLHAPGEPGELLECMRRLHVQPELRLELGQAAAARAAQLFSEPLIIGALVDFYRVRLDS